MASNILKHFIIFLSRIFAKLFDNILNHPIECQCTLGAIFLNEEDIKKKSYDTFSFRVGGSFCASASPPTPPIHSRNDSALPVYNTNLRIFIHLIQIFGFSFILPIHSVYMGYTVNGAIIIIQECAIQRREKLSTARTLFQQKKISRGHKRAVRVHSSWT